MTSRGKVVLIVAAMVCAILLQQAQAQAETRPITPLWGPYCTGAIATDRVVHWKTAEPTWGAVQYATEENLRLQGRYTDLVIANELSQIHQVILSNLQPGTAYRYRVWIMGDAASREAPPNTAAGDAEDWLIANGSPSQDCSFRTLGDEPFTFVVYGDTQQQDPWFTQMERHKLVADAIAREEDLAFVVHLGDYTYDADNMAGWDTFFEAAREMLGRNTLYPVIGNHENNSPTYFEIMGAPPYYSFVAGDSRFTVLDTNSWADFEAQRRWLEELDPDSGWDFVFYHHPAFSSDARNYGGWEQSTKAWGDAFAQAHVTALFSGHVHAYERYLSQGMHHLVLGIGGGALTDLNADAPDGLQNRLAQTLGYAKVTVRSQAVTIEIAQVARISDDNRAIEQIYPFGSVYETVTIEPFANAKPIASPAGSLKVSPASLNIAVDRDSSQRFSVRIISSHDAQVRIGAESLPFEVKPAVVQVDSSEQGQKFEIELFGNKRISDGQYEGKLTFLRDAGDNVALGVKVKTIVTQASARSKLIEGLKDNLALIIAVALVISLNITGYVLYRRYKARLAQSKDAQ